MKIDNQQSNETQPYPSYPGVTPPPAPKKRSWWKRYGCLAIVVVVALIVAIVGIAAVVGLSMSDGQPASQPQATTAPDTGATAMAGNTPVTSQPTQAVQPTTAPAQSAAQIESAYKASTTDTTVSGVDKNGSSWTGKDVHFTAVISGLVKDDSGNTAGANVSDPANEFGHDIQVGFPAGTDINKLNQGDTIEVWGIDGGTQSGANAFGATVQEVVVGASYLTDTTTGYQDNG